MKNSIFIISFIFFCLSANGILNAQGSLPSEEVEVVKSFDARLANAERLAMKPQLPPFDTSQLDYDFKINQRTIDPTYQPPAIKALGMSSPPRSASYNGYLRGGYGLPSSPLVDVHYTFDNQDNFMLSFDGSHYSLDNTSKLEHQFMMENDAAINTRYIVSDGLAITGGIDFSLDRYDLYGYDHELDSFSQSEAERAFQTIGVKAGIENPMPNDWGLDYRLDVYFQNHEDNRSASENNFGATAEITKWFNKKNPLSIRMGASNTSFADLTTEAALDNYFVEPTFSFYRDNWSAKVGGQFAYGNNETYIYPVINVQVRVLDSRIVAFAGSDGQLSPQNFLSLSRRNPYINTNFDSLYNTSLLDIYGGIKGEYNRISYQLKGSYQIAENLPFFLPSPDDSRLFDLVVDNGSIIELSASADYQMNEQLSFSASAVQQIINLDTLAAAFHMPTLTIDGKAAYTFLKGDLTVWSGITFQNGVPILNETLEVERLGSLVDLSLGVDYYFSDRFGLFLHGYNLLNNTRQRWQAYPIVGTNVLGGLMMRF